MFNLRKLNTRPYILVEAAIAVHLVFFILFWGGGLNRIATLCGAVAAVWFGLEMIQRGELSRCLNDAKPLLPFALFLFLSALVLPLLPDAESRVWNNFTGMVVLTMVFIMARRFGHLPILETIPPVIVISMVVITVIAPGFADVGPETGERVRYTVSEEVRGMGASSISLVVGTASFLSLRRLFINIGRQKRYLSAHNLFLSGSIALGAYLIIFYSGSRQGMVWLMFAACFVAGVIFRKNLGIGALVVIVAALSLGVFSYYFLGETLVVQRTTALFDPLTQAYDPEKSALMRMEFIRYGLEMWKQSPVWGNGNEAFRVQYGTYSHNNYIELLANYGLLGFGLFYTPIVVILVLGYKRLLRTHDSELRKYLIWTLMAVAAILASNMFIPSYYMKIMLVFMGFVFGFFYFLEDRTAVRVKVSRFHRERPPGRVGSMAVSVGRRVG